MGERRSGETAAVLGLGTPGAGAARPQQDCIILTCVLRPDWSADTALNMALDTAHFTLLLATRL